MNIYHDRILAVLDAVAPTLVFLILIWWLFYKGRKSQRRKINKIINKKNGLVVADCVAVATVTVFRMVGLLNTPRLHGGEALIIKPARTIHSMGMRFPIDVVFLDRHLKVLKIFDRLEPTNRACFYRGGFSSQLAIELPAGTIQNTDLQIGDQIQLIA
jgi:uncharacterized membrane protein (UPF0127 family)